MGDFCVWGLTRQQQHMASWADGGGRSMIVLRGQAVLIEFCRSLWLGYRLDQHPHVRHLLDRDATGDKGACRPSRMVKTVGDSARRHGPAGRQRRLVVFITEVCSVFSIKVIQTRTAEVFPQIADAGLEGVVECGEWQVKVGRILLSWHQHLRPASRTACMTAPFALGTRPPRVRSARTRAGEFVAIGRPGPPTSSGARRPTHLSPVSSNAFNHCQSRTLTASPPSR